MSESEGTHMFEGNDIHIKNLASTPRGAILLAVLSAVGVAPGSSPWGKRGAAASVGAAAGGIVGGVIGNQTGSTARGAIIGAVIGGTAGALIGEKMDRQARELEVAIPGAIIERVGEGIQVTFSSGLLYDFDSDAIRPAAAENLESLAANLLQNADTDLLIVGHTDAVGSDSYNQELSTRRAEAAQWFLTRHGVASSRIHSSGRGEMEPLSTNESEAGRQANRRIEVAIYAHAGAGDPR